jgi:hypothetical protein
MRRLTLPIALAILLLVSVLAAMNTLSAEAEGEGCEWFTYTHTFADGLGIFTGLNNAELYGGRLRMKPSADGDDHGYAYVHDHDLLAEFGIPITYHVFIARIGADPDEVSTLPSVNNAAGFHQDTNPPYFTYRDWLKVWRNNSTNPLPDDYHLYDEDDRPLWYSDTMEVNHIVFAVTHGGIHNNHWIYWDDVYIYGCGCPPGENPPEEEPPPDWGANAWLYYPYEEADAWSQYQTYSETSWYGDAYQNYWVWQMRPGASFYPLATLDIIDVGINSFGYYIDSRINAWPDVPSTTVRYEGLQTVNIAAGQRVGVNCKLGTVGPNPYLGGDPYHLLLYIEYDGDSYNPVPYMGKYPNPAMCVPTDPNSGETIGPGAGEVPSVIIETCQYCNPPASWTNFGRWIVWLECMIQNLFMCDLINWLNGIINMQIITLEQAYQSANALMGRFNDLVGVNVMILGRIGDTGDWLAEPVNGGLDWLDAAITGALSYSTGGMDDFGSRIDNLGYIIMSYAGGGNTIIYQDASTNYWDVLVGIINLMSNVVDLFILLIDGIFTILITATNLIANIANLGLMLVTGVVTGITGTSQPSDLILGATNITTLSCTETGAFADSEPSQEKALCYVLTSIGLGNNIIDESAWRYFPAIAIGIMALGLAFWIMGQFQEILPS